MKLVRIPENRYDNYRLDVIFKGYKWDPQFSDCNTIANHVLVISEDEHRWLEELTLKLDEETIHAEEILSANLKLAKPLRLPKKILEPLKTIGAYNPELHIRLMRYDFHPTVEGNWAVSEVNSDVPGGFAEASIMPKLACEALGGECYRFIDFSKVIAGAFTRKVKAGGRIMLAHCTSYSDDRQVMQFLGDKLEESGFIPVYCAADHLVFQNRNAASILNGYQGKVDGIFRFTPLEWLIGIKPERWIGYFDTITPSCNHPISIFAQTKRFPLVWDALEEHGAVFASWRSLLPQTIEVKDAKDKDGFIFKPAFGRVGEGISIAEACSEDEYEKIIKDVRKNPGKYLAQKKFDSMPLVGENGASFHVCLGSYTVDGQAAGYYARINRTPRIDSNAADIPVLIEKKK
ncbi:MAG: glutathionylspermidine synthase family protein [Eubacteriaceae bacterium]|nr:glutathionylspermidine synthase family protein [Eubacteriaceae bacterium]